MPKETLPFRRRCWNHGKNMEKLLRLFHPCHVPGGSPTNSNKSMKHGTAKPPQLTTSQQTKTDAIKFHVYTTCFWISLCSHKWIYSLQSPDFDASSPKWNRKLSRFTGPTKLGPDNVSENNPLRRPNKRPKPGSNNNSFWQDLPNIHKLNDTSQKRVGNGRQRPPKNMIYQQYKRYRRRSPYWASRATTFHVNICLRVPIFKKKTLIPQKLP